MRQLVRRVPQLQRLAVFEAVAAAGGFSAAAIDLGISQPAVSRHIKALSNELGVELFERSGRSYVLTRNGRLLADALGDSFTHIERALDQMVDKPDALVFAVQPAMATSWVVPLLDQLEAAAGCDIQLRIFDRRSELDSSAWDLAIVPGSGRWPDWESTVLFREIVRPLAAPSFASEFGLSANTDPLDLVGKTLLHIDDVERPSMNWPAWFAEAGIEVDLPIPRLVYNAYPTVIQEALAGNGIALGWRHLLSDLVERGLLVPVGPSVERKHSGHHVCWRTHRGDERHKAILDFLQDEIGAHYG